MTIQGVGNPVTSQISRVNATSGLSSSGADLTVDDVSSVDSQVSISGPTQLLTKLQNLEASDPAKAKDVLHALADKVREQATSTTGDRATHLGALADKLDQAADSGDLSGLSPSKQAGKAHHHHHHGGGGSGAPADASATGETTPDSASAAYFKQQQQQGAQGGGQAKDLWNTLNATFDSLTS